MSEWAESTDEPGTWRLKAGVLDLTAIDCGEKGAAAWIRVGNLCLWRSGRPLGELTVVTAKAAAVAKAREFARVIEAALPPAPNVFGDCSGPFVSRCQVCMVKHSPHCIPPLSDACPSCSSTMWDEATNRETRLLQASVTRRCSGCGYMWEVKNA